MIQGLALSITFFGEQPDNASLGGWLVLAGVATMLLGCVCAPRLANADLPWVRALLALPTALAAASLLSEMGYYGPPPWFGDTSLFVMVCVAIAVLVPPRNAVWGGGFVAGCLIAGFARLPAYGAVLLALAVLVAAVALGDQREASRS